MGKAFLYGNGGDNIDTEQITATTADILEGKKAYIDDSGEAKAGTIQVVNPTIADHLQAIADPVFGNYSSDKPAQPYLYSRLKSDGQANTVAYNGVNWIRTEASKVASIVGLTADKIAQRNTICGVTGTAYTDGGMVNFPLTISLSQPSPVRAGHIWVNTSRATSPSRIYIYESILSDTPDNSIMFVVGDMTNSHMNVASFSNGIPVTTFYNANGLHEWSVGSLDGHYYYNLPIPTVYTKVNGVIYIETAYMWDGSKWLNISNADKYVASRPKGSGEEVYIYNVANHLLTRKANGMASYAGSVYSKNLQYIVCRTTSSYGSDLKIFKRTGDTFSLMQQISNSSLMSSAGVAYSISLNTYRGDFATFSSDGKYMVLIGEQSGLRIFKYSLNSSGTHFDLIGSERLDTDQNIQSIQEVCFCDDLSTFFVLYRSATSYGWHYCHAYKGNVRSGYTRLSSFSSGNTNQLSRVAISPNGKYFYYSYSSSSSRFGYIDGMNTIISSSVSDYSFCTANGGYSGTYINDDGEVLVVHKESRGYWISHAKIKYLNGIVSYDSLNSNGILIKNCLSSPNSDGDNNVVADITFRRDKGNCYMLVGIGGSYEASNVSIVKIGFDSSGKLSSLTEVGVSTAYMNYIGSKLIGY